MPTTIATTAEPNPASDLPDLSDNTEKPTSQDAVSTAETTPEATEAAASTKEVPVVSTEAPVIQTEASLKTTALTDTTKSTEAGPKETASPEVTTVFLQHRAEKPEGTPNAGVEDAG